MDPLTLIIAIMVLVGVTLLILVTRAMFNVFRPSRGSRRGCCGGGACSAHVFSADPSLHGSSHGSDSHHGCGCDCGCDSSCSCDAGSCGCDGGCGGGD